MRVHNLKDCNGNLYMLVKDALFQNALNKLDWGSYNENDLARYLLSIINKSEQDYSSFGRKVVDCSTTVPDALHNGRVYDFGTKTESDSITVPSLYADEGYYTVAEIQITTGDTCPTVTWPENTVWPDEENTDQAPTLVANTTHCFTMRNMNNNKLIAVLSSVM